MITAAGVAAVGAGFDARTGHIPNWLTLGALGCAPVAHAVVGLARHLPLTEALERAGYSVLGVACALVPLVLFKKGAMGGGDVKLFAAIGALCGFEVGLDIVLHSFVVAAILAVAVVVYKGKLLRMMKNVGTVFLNLLRRAKKPVAEETFTAYRMGPAIFLATALEVLLRWRGR